MELCQNVGLLIAHAQLFHGVVDGLVLSGQPHVPGRQVEAHEAEGRLQELQGHRARVPLLYAVGTCKGHRPWSLPAEQGIAAKVAPDYRGATRGAHTKCARDSRGPLQPSGIVQFRDSNHSAAGQPRHIATRRQAVLHAKEYLSDWSQCW